MNGMKDYKETEQYAETVHFETLKKKIEALSPNGELTEAILREDSHFRWAPYLRVTEENGEKTLEAVMQVNPFEECETIFRAYSIESFWEECFDHCEDEEVNECLSLLESQIQEIRKKRKLNA